MRDLRVPPSERGSALVELAVALPILILLLVGVGDFARVFYSAMELTAAARAGAQWGGMSLSNAANAGTMQSKAVAAAPNLTGVTAAAAVRCKCANDTGSTFTNTTPSVNNCTAVTAVSCPTAGTHRVLWVEVTATQQFQTTINYPVIPHTVSLSRTSTMRVSE